MVFFHANFLCTLWCDFISFSVRKIETTKKILFFRFFWVIPRPPPSPFSWLKTEDWRKKKKQWIENVEEWQNENKLKIKNNTREELAFLFCSNKSKEDTANIRNSYPMCCIFHRVLHMLYVWLCSRWIGSDCWKAWYHPWQKIICEEHATVKCLLWLFTNEKKKGDETNQPKKKAWQNPKECARKDCI